MIEVRYIENGYVIGNDLETRDLDKEERRKEHKMVTRVKCKACLRIKYDQKRRLYFVRKFMKEYNYQIATMMEVRFLRANRNVPNANIDHACALHGWGLGLAK